ncbi:MAG: glutamate 5-kinase, partial [Nocardioides sp.]
MSLDQPDHRIEVTGARRVVVKVGSSSLTTAAGGIDPARISKLVDVLAAACARGTEVVLVSSGAIAAGLAPLGLKRRPRGLPAQQAAASVGQGLLVHRYTDELARHGLVAGQVLLTVDDMTRRSHYRNAFQTFAKLLELGVLPIVNENDTVATTEIRFGDNDRLAALVAHLVHADLLVLLSDVDGLYDGDPAHPGSALLPEVTSSDDLARVRIGKSGSGGLGSGGMKTKIEAARIATGAGIPVVLTSTDQAAQALEGGSVGTLFKATGRRRPTRLLWLAHATEPQGTLLLDPGAVR